MIGAGGSDIGESGTLKSQVKEFWNQAACGEQLYLREKDIPAFEEQRRIRYALEPIREWVQFESFRGLRTLEIGIGLGADHQSLAEAGAILTGVDLTERAVELTRYRFELFGLASSLRVADAECLPFPDASFDAVYSWGVIHHSPDTKRAAAEIRRVLKPGGIAKVMIYHRWSIVGYMLWLRYALGGLRPWRTLTEVYAEHLESPGTKAFSISEAREMFRGCSEVKVSTPVGHSDLLTSRAGQRHTGALLSMARKVWPRWFIRRFLGQHGLSMRIELRA